MRLPDPIANTTTEAYLAYKAGVLESGDLKPKLYYPTDHFDAWLAYWTGLTNTYPLDKNNDPEMLTDEEALVAYLAGVTDTYPDSVKDPYDVRIAGYLRYLVSARFGRPEYPVNNEELYLSMLKPPVVTNATPSTDIELNGTVEAEFVDVKLYGQTSQDTYTGEQLLMKQGYATPTSDTDFWASFATSKVSKRDLSDDWAEITVGGTEGSGFGDMNIKPGNVLNFTANTTYTIILEFKDKSGAGTSGDSMINFNVMQPGSTNDAWVRESINIVQGALNKVSNIVVTLADSNWTSRTAVIVATTKEDISGKYALRTFTRPQVPVGTKFKIRATVLAGDHSSDWQNYAGDNYQPYLNGEFSPNPYAPQPVNMVTGSQDIAIHGKNLFRSKSKTDGGIKFEYNEDTGEMTVSGTPSIYYAVATRIYPQKPLPAGTYTISIQDTLPFNAGVGTYNPSGTRTARAIAAGNKKSTFTVSTTINSFDFYLTSMTAGQDIGTHTIKFQLEEGSEATSFEPYIGGDHIVSLGQNLLSIPDGTYSNSGVSAVVDGETITVNRTSTNNNTSFIRIPLDKPIHLAQGEKLWIEANNPHYIGNSTDDYMAIRLRADTDVGSTDLTLIETDNKREFVADKDYDFDYFVIRTDSKLSPDNFVIRPEYFIDPVELGMIETYEDYIYQDGREWFIKKYVKKVVLDGTDDDNLYWTRENTSGDWIKFNADCLDMMYHQHPVVCSHFKYLNQDNANSGIEHIYTFYGYHGFCIWVKQSLASTMEDWRAWLAANKPVLYYELQEPVDIQITDPRLIAQLDELKKSGSYDKTTYITVSASGDDLPALLKIEAGA